MTDDTDQPSALTGATVVQPRHRPARARLHAPDEIRIALYKRPPFLRPRVTPCCDLCGFTLAGLSAPGVCPECGMPFTEVSAHRLLETPSARTVIVYLARPLLVPMFCVAVLLAHDFNMLRVLDTVIWWIAVTGVCLYATQFAVRASNFAFLAVDEILPLRHPLRRPIHCCGYLAGTVFVFTALASVACVVIGFGAFIAMLVWVLF